MPSYFLPPVTWYLPPAARTPEVRSRKYRLFFGYWRSDEITIDGVLYPGARWAGPLTAGQISSITAAGLEGRIATVTDVLNLPGWAEGPFAAPPLPDPLFDDPLVSFDDPTVTMDGTRV